MTEIFDWAWARHHNILSWYIRPLFLIPFCYFAYRRQAGGVVLTLVALATSMAWFPAPASPRADVVGFLAAEKAFFLDAWSWQKTLMASMVPLSLGLLAAAFWRRSWVAGALLLNAIAIGKITWSYAYGGVEGALALAAPALTGLAICDAAVGLAWYISTRHSASR